MTHIFTEIKDEFCLSLKFSDRLCGTPGRAHASQLFQNLNKHCHMVVEIWNFGFGRVLPLKSKCDSIKKMRWKDNQP